MSEESVRYEATRLRGYEATRLRGYESIADDDETNVP